MKRDGAQQPQPAEVSMPILTDIKESVLVIFSTRPWVPRPAGVRGDIGEMASMLTRMHLCDARYTVSHIGPQSNR